MSTLKKLILVGAGGAGAEALWVARRMNQAVEGGVWEIIGVTDDNPDRAGEQFDGVPVVGTGAQAMVGWRDGGVFFHCAVGNNRQRQRLVDAWEAAGFAAAALIDPTAIVADTARVGAGTYIGPLSIVAPHAKVGRHVLINTHVGVGHHAVVGDYVQLCPGGRVSGRAVLDEGSFIGSNGVLAPGIRLGEWSTLGADSLAARDIPARVTAIGVPAKVLAPSPGA